LDGSQEPGRPSINLNQTTEYAYDLAGNRTRIQTHVINGTAASDSDRHFSYELTNW